jgi:hypothetical protein
MKQSTRCANSRAGLGFPRLPSAGFFALGRWFLLFNHFHSREILDITGNSA